MRHKYIQNINILTYNANTLIIYLKNFVLKLCILYIPNELKSVNTGLGIISASVFSCIVSENNCGGWYGG